jgi:DNA-binding IscR family transcriptional regulator
MQTNLSLKRRIAVRRAESLPIPERVLRLLAGNGGEMIRNRLKDRLQVKLAILDPILDELEQQGKVKITLGRKGGTISLRRPN